MVADGRESKSDGTYITNGVSSVSLSKQEMSVWTRLQSPERKSKRANVQNALDTGKTDSIATLCVDHVRVAERRLGRMRIL